MEHLRSQAWLLLVSTKLSALHSHIYCPQVSGTRLQMLPVTPLWQGSPRAQGSKHSEQVLEPKPVAHPSWSQRHWYKPQMPPLAGKHLLPGLPLVKQGSDVAQVSSQATRRRQRRFTKNVNVVRRRGKEKIINLKETNDYISMGG